MHDQQSPLTTVYVAPEAGPAPEVFNTWPGWMIERKARPFSESNVLRSVPVARAIP